MLQHFVRNVCSICSQCFRSVSFSSVTPQQENGRSAIRQAYHNRNLMQTKLDDQLASQVRLYCKQKHLSINSFLKLAVHNYLLDSNNG